VTQAAEILSELRGRGVNVKVEGDILCLRPRRALDDALLARVRDSKPAILEALRKLPPHAEAHANTPGSHDVLALRRLGRMQVLDMRDAETVHSMGGWGMRCLHT
jgi:hypothetical protein